MKYVPSLIILISLSYLYRDVFIQFLRPNQELFLQKNGFDTSINVNPITQDALSTVNVLVFASPMTKFDTQEINAIKNCVQNGGNLLVLAHRQ